MPELPDVFKAEGQKTIDDGFTPLPDGWYPSQIVSSDKKETRDNNNNLIKYMIELKFKIIEGEGKGRIIFQNLNYINPNETTMQIAKRELASICKALDLSSVSDTVDLHGQPLQIKLVTRPASGGYPAKNAIKNYRSIEESDDSEEDDDIPF